MTDLDWFSLVSAYVTLFIGSAFVLLTLFVTCFGGKKLVKVRRQQLYTLDGAINKAKESVFKALNDFNLEEFLKVKTLVSPEALGEGGLQNG